MSKSSPEQTETFEAQIKALESIVESLEDDMPPLDEALASYEKGVGIAKNCLERLEQAELRIKSLKLEE